MSPSELTLRRDTALAGRVLVVASEDAVGGPLRDLLDAGGHDVRLVGSGADAVSLAVRFLPELVVVSRSLPGLDGLGVCRALRADQRTADARIIVIGPSEGAADLVDGLESGADDYFDDSIDLTELSIRIRASLRRDRSLRESSPLTGMPGNARITAMVARCIDDATPFALVHADLRNFKAYNDRYGFARGDEALLVLARVVADVGSALAGTPRLFGHLGGDDFALVCPPQLVRAVCDEIVARFDASVQPLYDLEDWENGFIEVTNRRGERATYSPLTVSLGVTTSVLRSFVNAAEAAAVATEMKQLAKLVPQSAWRMDKRTS
ncbi:MAG: diguanylate cyclase [Acidimicrobiales bacterium]